MKKITCIAIACIVLTGCGTDVKKTLGFEKTVPDEFAVVERAPLTVPPEFNLAPPTDGSAAPIATTTPQARSLVLGSQVNSPPAGVSRSEQLLLQKAGPSNPEIRQQLAVEKDVREQPKSTIEKLGLKKGEQEAGKALDPIEEAKKLQDKKIPTTPLRTVPEAQ